MITSFIEYFDEHPAPSMSEMLDRVEGRPPRTFESDMRRDIREFLSLDAFAEMVTLNGVKLRAQVLWQSADRQKPDLAHKNKAYYIHPEMHAQTIPGELCTVYFRSADYLREKERLPKNTESCYLNGSRYYVKTMSEEYGLAELSLEADRQNTPLTGSRLPRLPEL